MKNNYVTFGQGHVHYVNGKTFDKDTVAVFKAETFEEARLKTFEIFGKKWFTCYFGEAWKEEQSLKFFPKGYVYLD